MASGFCVVESCGREGRVTRGMCSKHYAKWQRHGDPLAGRQNATQGPAQALALRSKSEGDCRIWTGSDTGNGYGVVRIAGRLVLAHRASYELANGPIPEGMVIDHLCHSRGCIEPKHLRAVTQKQNLENNATPNPRNKSGVRGVFWSNRLNAWVAQVCHNYQRHHVGTFASLAEAEVAVIAKRIELFTHNDLDRAAA